MGSRIPHWSAWSISSAELESWPLPIGPGDLSVSGSWLLFAPFPFCWHWERATKTPPSSSEGPTAPNTVQTAPSPPASLPLVSLSQPRYSAPQGHDASWAVQAMSSSPEGLPAALLPPAPAVVEETRPQRADVQSTSPSAPALLLLQPCSQPYICLVPTPLWTPDSSSDLWLRFQAQLPWL